LLSTKKYNRPDLPEGSRRCGFFPDRAQHAAPFVFYDWPYSANLTLPSSAILPRGPEPFFDFLALREVIRARKKLFHSCRNFAQRFILTLRPLAITMQAILGQQNRAATILRITVLSAAGQKCYKRIKGEYEDYSYACRRYSRTPIASES
jgi:hypothetical protein